MMHFWIFLEPFHTPLAADPIPPYPSSLLPWELIHLSHRFNAVTSSLGYIDPISWIWSFMWPLPCWHPLNHPLCQLIFSAPHMSYTSQPPGGCAHTIYIKLFLSPCTPCLPSYNAGFIFLCLCVFPRLLLLNYRQSTAIKFMVLSPFFFMFRILFTFGK